MPNFKPAHEADALATIIAFRPRRLQTAKHLSVRPHKPPPPSATDDQRSRLCPTAQQLSLFETGTVS